MCPWRRRFHVTSARLVENSVLKLCFSKGFTKSFRTSSGFTTLKKLSWLWSRIPRILGPACVLWCLFVCLVSRIFIWNVSASKVQSFTLVKKSKTTFRDVCFSLDGNDKFWFVTCRRKYFRSFTVKFSLRPIINVKCSQNHNILIIRRALALVV